MLGRHKGWLGGPHARVDSAGAFDVPAFRTSLGESLDWCYRRFSMEDLPGCLRSEELRPSGDVTDVEDATSIVEGVVARRKAALPALVKEWPRIRVLDGWDSNKRDVRNVGRLVAFQPAFTTVDGTSPPETGGFFDDSDTPPWDTWVAYHAGQLVAWVPANVVSAVDQAIAVNATECILWLGDLRAPFVSQLRKAHLVF